MTEKVLVTGGTGFIGQVLVQQLLQEGHAVTVFSRNALPIAGVDVVNSLPDSEQWPYTVVVNLAGENLFAKRWSDKQKDVIRQSRLSLTRALSSKINSTTSVKRYISGSAIGYYGPTGDERLDETTAPGEDFAAKLCQDWEQAAHRSDRYADVICLRIGVVLGHGGALDNLLPSFKLGVGGRIGSGQQWFSWIHIDDLVAMICAAVRGDLNAGTYNATAPNPVQNQAFASELGKVLRRPVWLPMPSFALRALLGEVSSLLTTGQRVVPVAAEKAGFTFRYPTAELALSNLLAKR